MARILVLSESKGTGKDFARLLRQDGHRADLAGTELAASRLLTSRHHDMIVLSLADPAAALRVLGRAIGSSIRRTPAIGVVPGDTGALDRDTPGLLDLLPTPFSEEDFLARVDALLRVRQVLFARGASMESSDTDVEASDEAHGFWGFVRRLAFTEVRIKPRRRPLAPYLETAASMMGNVEGRDGLDQGHGERTAQYCADMAKVLGLGDEEKSLLFYAAQFHDIGKIALSADLLRKPNLTERDRLLLRQHPQRGAELIRALTPYDGAAEIVLHHHERPDGGGYYHKSANEVSAAAKILAVAEVYDAMTSSRSERPALTPEQAIASLRAGSGVFYDAQCVEALASTVRPKRSTVPVSSFPLPYQLH